MKSIQEKYNTSALIITHDVDCARVISNRMILLVDGIIMPKALLMNYRLQQIQSALSLNDIKNNITKKRDNGTINFHFSYHLVMQICWKTDFIAN
jgi:ABC-type glutathione transport system ATPase component